MAAFKVIDINGTIPFGFRLANFEDFVNLKLLRTALGSDEAWYICRLQDGTVAGPGYGYEVKQQLPDIRLGHKLLIRTLHSGDTFLYLEERDIPPPPQFQLAEVTDIVHLDILKDAMSDKRWHICKLLDGHVMGPGYGYLIAQKPYHADVSHKLVVGPRELVEDLFSEINNQFSPQRNFKSKDLNIAITRIAKKTIKLDLRELDLTVLHSERPKLYVILAALSAIGLNKRKFNADNTGQVK